VVDSLAFEGQMLRYAQHDMFANFVLEDQSATLETRDDPK
jgi:hypothetical protein